MPEPVGFSGMFPYYTIATAIAMVLALIPTPAHWRSGNVGTVSLGLWAAGGNIIAFVNSIVWRGNMNNTHPIWGDIVSFYFGNMGVAIASCNLAIIYRLYEVSKSRSILVTKAQKRRQSYLTYFLCWGVPIIQGLLHYIVQGHRYDIFEDLGPDSTFYLTLPSFFLYLMWEPLICLISAIYFALSMRFFLKKRREFDTMFGTQSAHLTKNRYTRLLALSAFGISIHLPISTIVLIADAAVYHVNPWISWDDTHSNYGRIAYFSRFIIDATPFSKDIIMIEYSFVPLTGICYFAFFGFGEEAFRHYKAAVWWLLTPLGFLKIKFPKYAKTGSGGSDGTKADVSKSPKRFGLFPRPEGPSKSPFAQMSSSQISPLSSRSTGPITSYISNMFSSFGTLYSNDVRSRIGAIDSQLSRVSEVESQSQSQSQHQYQYPHSPFNLNMSETESAHRALPNSGLSTLRNSKKPDLSEVVEEKEKDITDHRHVPTLAPAISRSDSEASSLPNQSDKKGEDEKADSMSIPVLDPLPSSNRNGEQGCDLEAGGSTFHTETLAAIEAARAQFKQDNPELTEEVTF